MTVEKFPFLTAASQVLVVGEKQAAWRKSTLFWMVLEKVPTMALADSVDGGSGGSETHGTVGSVAVVGQELGLTSEEDALPMGSGRDGEGGSSGTVETEGGRGSSSQSRVLIVRFP